MCVSCSLKDELSDSQIASRWKPLELNEMTQRSPQRSSSMNAFRLNEGAKSRGIVRLEPMAMNLLSEDDQ